MAVYVLHFSPAYKHARHYIGFTKYNDCEQRVQQHLDGKGARLTRIAVEAGCKITVAAIFKDADRAFERQLKNMKNTKKWCPICKKG